MTANNYFDKILCINLNRRTDRWKICQKEFQRHNLKVERFAAIDGQKFTAGTTDWMTGPRIGCCKSHVNILKMMVQNNLKRILIIEDDIHFIDNFQEVFCEKIKFVPQDYDMLYLCGNNPKKLEKINDHLFKISSALSTGCYAISINFAKRIIPEIDKFKEPVDCVYSANTPNCQCYIFNPYLCQQRADFSDIENKFTDYSAVFTINYADIS